MDAPFQYSYTVPAGHPLDINSEVLAFEILTLFRGLSDQASCLGSGFVIRAIAVEEISSFPEETMQVDTLISWYMAAAGWTIVCVPELVPWGLEPDTVAEFLKQAQWWQ